MGKNIKNLWIRSPEKFLESIKVNKIGDMVKFIKQYDINVGVFSSDTDSKVLPQNILSYIMIKDDIRMIGVRSDLTLETQRFMLGYLFSSYVLRGNDESFADSIYYETVYDKEVYDYMLSLLMPDDYFRKMAVRANGNLNLLKHTYKINENVIREKIKKIGKLK